MFLPAELGEGSLQVSVAQLWEGAHVGGGNQTSHPDDTPVVRTCDVIPFVSIINGQRRGVHDKDHI